MDNNEVVYWVLPSGTVKLEKAEQLVKKLFTDYTVDDNNFGGWLYKDISVKTSKLKPNDMEAFVDLVNVADLFDINANLNDEIEINFSILTGERAEEK